VFLKATLVNQSTETPLFYIEAGVQHEIELVHLFYTLDRPRGRVDCLQFAVGCPSKQGPSDGSFTSQLGTFLGTLVADALEPTEPAQVIQLGTDEETDPHDTYYGILRRASLCGNTRHRESDPTCHIFEQTRDRRVWTYRGETTRLHPRDDLTYCQRLIDVAQSTLNLVNTTHPPVDMKTCLSTLIGLVGGPTGRVN
jgi:hypothetical protein